MEDRTDTAPMGQAAAYASQAAYAVAATVKGGGGVRLPEPLQVQHWEDRWEWLSRH